MRIGIIGAGRVGCSLGKYFRLKGAQLAGYYDASAEASKEAAEFTQTDYFETLEQLVSESEILFITTPDTWIVPVWEEIKGLSLTNQIICHCSGALSSDSFSGSDDMGVSCCSVHPMLPFSNKFSSYKQLNKAFFTVEGQPRAVEVISHFLETAGNEVCRIDGACKPKYHAAASILSNHVIAVLDAGYHLLEECGFSREEAVRATAELVRCNVENVLEKGCEEALTGPIERMDTGTVQKHLDCLSSEDAGIYCALGSRLADLAEKKHPGQDYDEMRRIMERK